MLKKVFSKNVFTGFSSFLDAPWSNALHAVKYCWAVVVLLQIAVENLKSHSIPH